MSVSVRMQMDADDVRPIIQGLETIVDAAPILAYNVANIIGDRVKQVAQHYIGSDGPNFRPWAPNKPATASTKGHSQILLGGFRRGGYLGKPGDMARGIKITSRRRGLNPYVIVSATNWKSEIHENGVKPAVHKPFAGPVRIPKRPFMGPAVAEVENDAAFHKAILEFVYRNLEAMAFSKTGRAAQWFYKEQPEFNKGAYARKGTPRKFTDPNGGPSGRKGKRRK